MKSETPPDIANCLSAKTVFTKITRDVIPLISFVMTMYFLKDVLPYMNVFLSDAQRAELERRPIPVVPSTFFHYIRYGDQDYIYTMYDFFHRLHNLGHPLIQDECK